MFSENLKPNMVRSCLLVTLIKCPKGHKCVGSLCRLVKTLIVQFGQTKQGTRSPIELFWTAKDQICGIRIRILHLHPQCDGPRLILKTNRFDQQYISSSASWLPPTTTATERIHLVKTELHKLLHFILVVAYC